MKQGVLLPALLLTLVACTGTGGGDSVVHVNPDPNHVHADFAVWIHEERIDFSESRYMSDPYDDDYPHAEDGEERGVLHTYLHLHDGVGHVIHVHRPGHTLGEFFSSLGFEMDFDCMALDTGDRYCHEGQTRWRFIVNGRERPLDPDYVIKDLDKLLLSYGATMHAAKQEFAAMTDDACLYSRTCPERGDPPAENCVADPEIPCIAPLE